MAAALHHARRKRLPDSRVDVCPIPSVAQSCRKIPHMITVVTIARIASLWRGLSAVVVLGWLCSGLTAGEAKSPPWFAQFDHGPFLADTIAAAGDNVATKGYAVKLTGAGGALAGMCFDTDLMRMSAGWRGHKAKSTQWVSAARGRQNATWPSGSAHHG